MFFEGSYAVRDNWKEGSTVHFPAPDQSGIYSIIKKHVLNECMQFKHIGIVIEGKEQPANEESIKRSRQWRPAFPDGLTDMEVERSRIR